MGFIQQVKKANTVVGFSRPLSRVAALVGADSPKPESNTKALVPAKTRPASLSEFLNQVRAEAPRDVEDSAGTVVGLAAGALLWKDHRVLGGIAGASLGRNIPALFKDNERKMALGNLGATGAGVAGALLWGKHPVWGFLIGNIAGTVAAHFAGLREGG